MILALLCLLLSQFGWAQTDVPGTPQQPAGESPIPPESKFAEFTSVESIPGGISKLSLKLGRLPLLRDNGAVSVIVSGEFDRQDWSLLIRSRPLTLREGRFRAKVPIRSRDTYLTLRAVGPGGEVEQKVFKIFVREAPPPVPPAHLDMQVSVGVTSAKYTQTGFSNFDQKGVTGKFAARYHFRKSPWDIGGSTFVTLMPFGGTLSGVSARFLGVNVRMGYTFPGIVGRWRVSLLGGVYYSTMMVSGSDLGYSNYIAPQIFPAVAYKVGPRSEISSYAKFAPIADGFKVKAFSDREIAFGLAWNQKRENSKLWQLAFDYGDLAVSTPVGVATVKTLSLAVGYGF